MNRIILFLAIIFTLALPGQAMAALTAPTISEEYVSCTGVSASFFISGGGSSIYKIYESTSTDGGITWGTEIENTQIGGGSYLRTGLNVAKWYKWRVAAFAGVEGPSTTQRCPFWRNSSTVPLPDATAANYVNSTGERIANNSTENADVPVDCASPTVCELRTYRANNATDFYLDSVTGGYVDAAGTPTTSEILQWGAAKWGVPLDILKAMSENESNWQQDAAGDCRAIIPGYVQTDYPARSRTNCINSSLGTACDTTGDQCVSESLGILQIKWQPDESPNAGTKDLRWESTAFNVDYTGARLRYFYDGKSFCSGVANAAGQEWDSVGAHFDGGGCNWSSTGSDNYVENVQDWLWSDGGSGDPTPRPWGSY